MLRVNVLGTFIAILLLACYIFAQSSNNLLVSNVKDAESWEDLTDSYRLPNNTRPIAYSVDVRTRIHEGDFSFEGTVLIDIDILEITSTITLHHRQLTIQSIQLSSEDGIGVAVSSSNYDAVRELFTINLDGQLLAGTTYSLLISYSGILRLDGGGFYRSSYVNDNGNQVWFAATQLLTTDARHGFPCYDEPGYRGIFSISVTHVPSYSAISNMPVSSQDINADGSVTTRFEDTPPLSTFLIGYLISDFEYLEDASYPNIVHRTYARPNAVHLSQFALETGVRMWDALNDFVGFDLPLTKMDQIAVPNFARSWGLVTHREGLFLFNENTSTIQTKTGIVGIIGHELAHQWFGNDNYLGAVGKCFVCDHKRTGQFGAGEYVAI